MAKHIKDDAIRHRAKRYNRKLRECIGVVPDDLWEPHHIYCFDMTGMLRDYGLRNCFKETEGFK